MAGWWAPAPPTMVAARPNRSWHSGLAAYYGPRQVLTRVDLDVNAGEVVAITGENAAGKSTLARA